LSGARGEGGRVLVFERSKKTDLVGKETERERERMIKRWRKGGRTTPGTKIPSLLWAM